ncbi:MAG TPA: TetR/AcrR family transcriptional regulator [Candidatus Lumbricidophila sp.]|nr:TetR/AcrR family transcriptional regulator [Candidatus Lumbricidophila sp.]
MTHAYLATPPASYRGSVRTRPTQGRSARRLDELLDAAADLVDEIGADRLTTQAVAERAGASIGTVYRYFPDRVALLNALELRCVARYRQGLANEMMRREPATGWEFLELAIDFNAKMFRTEPGFVVSRAAEREVAQHGRVPEIAERIARFLELRYGYNGDPEALRLYLSVVVEIVNSLNGVAYHGATRDERFALEAKSVVRAYLEPRLGEALSTRVTRSVDAA